MWFSLLAEERRGRGYAEGIKKLAALMVGGLAIVAAIGHE